mgnify:CR=1 FL=1
MNPGKSYPDTDVVCKPKQSKLGDKDQMKLWLANVPSLDDNLDVRSPADLQKLLENWLSTESSDRSNNDSDDDTKSSDTPEVAKSKIDDAFKDFLEDDSDENDK